MRKSLILALTAIGAGAGYAGGVNEAATGPGNSEPSTWRWQVTSILAAQSDPAPPRAETVAAPGAAAFNPHNQRYAPLGLPRASAGSR